MPYSTLIFKVLLPLFWLLVSVFAFSAEAQTDSLYGDSLSNSIRCVSEIDSDSV